MQHEDTLKFYAIGTLSLDFLKLVSKYQPGLKVIAKSKRQLGGVGFNALSTALYVTDLFGRKAEGVLCTKLGAHPENDLKPVVLDRLQKNYPNMRIFDVARNDTNFMVPDFTIIIDQEAGDRFIPMAETVKSPPLSDIDKAVIAKDVAQSDVLILTSRMVEETFAAVQSAKKHGVKIALDFNLEDPDFVNSPHLDYILSSADIVMVPAEALTVAHPMHNFKEILFNMAVNNPKKLIAVSNGAKPVIMMNETKLSNFALPRLFSTEIDTLAAGDNRTGATASMLAMGAAMGIDYKTALMWGSTISSFSINYFGQEWRKHIQPLKRFCTEHLGRPPLVVHTRRTAVKAYSNKALSL